ncbi:MAG: GTP-binding protein, partial [Ilumatobacteraceae bacterium]
EEKPLKYPVMFRSADVVIINKIDLLPYLDFDLDLFRSNLRDVNPDVRTIETSAKSGEGVHELCSWITALAAKV